MPFREHRGGGKQGAPVDSIEARWNAKWASLDDTRVVSDLSRNENWPWVSQSVKAPGRVLEAGCGFAKWVAFLDGQGYEAYGIDYSHTAIARSLAVWPDLRLVQGDARNMPYHDDFFDAIVSFGVVEHDIDGPAAALGEMHRVLRPGGVLYCTVPCLNYFRRLGWQALQDRIVCSRTIRRLAGRNQDVGFYQYVFTRAEYVDVLEEVGFDVLDLVPLIPHSLMAKSAFRRRIIMGIHQRWPWCLTHMMGAICRRLSSE